MNKPYNAPVSLHDKLPDGTNSDSGSYAQIYMVASVPNGEYDVEFNMFALGWHDRSFRRAIRVSGIVRK